MVKELIYILLILCCLSSCEEAFNPAIDTVGGHLVVTSLISTDSSQNYVHLTKTSGFYDVAGPEDVKGATVKLIDGSGNITPGVESSPGYFRFQTAPLSDQVYKLQIVFNNDTYESESVTMPPTPSVTKFYTERLEVTDYQTDGYGVPYATTLIGRELYLDIPVTATLSHYRFGMRSVVQWYYQPPMLAPPPPPDLPPIYGWQSLYYKDNYNIAGPKQFSQNDLIEKHPLIMLPYSTALILKPDSLFSGWIFILDQYGTSQGSYDYHEKLNSQFAANGTLFDPVQTQVVGNITCKTDPSKKVYGYFDLNSYRQYRYFLYFTDPNPNGLITLREVTRYTDIPDNGQTIKYPPSWWE